VSVLDRSFVDSALVYHLTQACIFQTVDDVIDQTHAPQPAEYKLSTFLENIKVSIWSFMASNSIWSFDKRIGDSGTLGTSSIIFLVNK
jgi:hypothetical protein